MALKHFSLAWRVFAVSLAMALLWLVAILPWLRARGQEPNRLLTLLLAAALVGSAFWLGVGLHRAVRGLPMAAFRLRYSLDEGGLPPGFAEFLGNLAQEAGHIVLTFLVHNGHLGMYLEVPAEPGPEGFAPVVREAIRHPDVLAGESLQLPGRLAVRGLKAYAVVVPHKSGPRQVSGAPTPQAAKPLPNLPAPFRQALEGLQRRLEHVPPPAVETPTPTGDALGRILLEVLLQHGGNGEVRWHLVRDGRGIITVAAERPEMLRHLAAALPAAARRIPRPVWSASPKLWPLLDKLLEGFRNLYWWCPVYADWGGAGLVRQIWLPATAPYPDLDMARIRFPLPPDYKQPPPVLVLGRSSDERWQPVGLSLSRGVVPCHLLVVGGGAANEPFGLALVEEALRLGLGVLAVGDRFDGLGMLYNNLPKEVQERVARISPLAENPPRVGLLNPRADSVDNPWEAVRWLASFLEAEGITMTANREAVLLCQALAAAGLRDNPDFGLTALVTLLNCPQAARDLLGQGKARNCPEEIGAFLAAGDEKALPDWKLRAYAALVGQRLLILQEKAIQPPYLNLGSLFGQGGGLLCSLPMRKSGMADAASAQMARYLVYSALHLVMTTTLSQPVLLYLGDFPLYLTRGLPWNALRARNCMVVLSSTTLPEEAAALLLPPNLQQGGFASLVMAPPSSDRDRLATLLALPAEALDRLRGRNAVLQHPFRESWLSCALDALDVCPPVEADILPALGAAATEGEREEEGTGEDERESNEGEKSRWTDDTWLDADGDEEEEEEAGATAAAVAASVMPLAASAPNGDPKSQTRARLQERAGFLADLYARCGGNVRDVGDIGFPVLPPEEE